MVATAWILGGRSVPSTPPSVQELLPPEPRSTGTTASTGDSTTVSALQPPPGAHEDVVEGDYAAILPGAADSAQINEIPVEKISELKSLGWAVPYLTRRGYSHQYVETTSVDGARTIQAHLSDGENFVNVAETRAEKSGVELDPLSEKLYSVVDVERLDAQTLELSTGHEAQLYQKPEEPLWTAAVEDTQAQFVITSDLTAEAAMEITSWVIITDRSRVQLLPSSPRPADRLERGFEELASWFGT